jgi:uncharacterized protein
MSVKSAKARHMQFTDRFIKMYPELSSTRGHKTMVITIVVTEDCMLRCSYCYENCKTKNKMDKETGKHVIDMLFEESMKPDGYLNPVNTQAIVLEFIGGEPLLEIDLIDYMVEYFKYKATALDHPWKLNYMINITTNGIMYNDPKVQEFIEMNDGRLNIAITIDGDKKLHDSCRTFPDGRGSYDMVASAFKKHLTRNVVKNTKMTLSPNNISYLFEGTTHLFEEIGLDEVFSNCVFEKGWTVEHAKVFYSELKKLADYLIENDRYTYLSDSLFEPMIGVPMDEDDNQNWCGGTGKMLAISTDGKLYPCMRYMPFSLKEGSGGFDIGDYVHGFADTDERKNRIEEIKAITRRSQSTDECFTCPIAKGCAWCSAYNFEEFGTVNKRATYICVMHKARVLANRYFWQKLYRAGATDEEFPLNIPDEWALEIISGEELDMLKGL